MKKYYIFPLEEEDSQHLCVKTEKTVNILLEENELSNNESEETREIVTKTQLEEHGAFDFEVPQNNQEESAVGNDEESIAEILEELEKEQAENLVADLPEKNSQKHPRRWIIAGTVLLVVAVVFSISMYLVQKSQIFATTTSTVAKTSDYSEKETKKITRKEATTLQKKTQSDKQTTQTKNNQTNYVEDTDSDNKISQSARSIETTTSKSQTTTATHCTNNDNHSKNCGSCGMWFNTRNECESYISAQAHELALQYYYDTGKTKSPVMSYWCCSYCGKWTGSIDNY